MVNDKIVMELGELRLALDTAAVEGIVEVGRIPFMPGQSGLVSGVISLRNEPVAVVDVRKAFGLQQSQRSEHKIIVVREKNRLLGFDIGASDISFLWKEELGEGVFRQEPSRFIKGWIDSETAPVQVIDWTALFDEAARVLSTEGNGV